MDILSLANPCLDHDGMVDNTLHVAHIALGNIDIGIPLEHVRQVLPWPEHLHRLPRRQNEIVGIFSYRNQTIPLVDLHHWLGIESIESNKQHQQIMILGSEGRHIAFAVDELHGLKKFPHYAIQRIYQDTENDDEFFHSIIMCNENNRFINLLDPERLLKKAQAWSSGVSKLPNTTRPNIHPSDIPNNTTKNHYKKHYKKNHAYIMFYVGEHLLAIPSLQINEVLIKPEHQEVFGMSSSLLGMARWRNRDLPIIDLANYFHDDYDSNHCELVIVIKDENNQILGLPVSKMCAVRNITQEKIQPIDPLIHSSIFNGTLLLEDNQRLFLIDCDHLFNITSWSSISNVMPHQTATKKFEPSLTTVEHKAHSAANETSYLVFEANGEWATSIQEIRAILPLPTLKKTPKAIEGIVGCCEWRNNNVPVMDLRPQNQQGIYTRIENAQPPRLIIISTDNRHFGFIVNNVIELLPTQYNQHSKGRIAGSTFHVITVTQGAKRSYHVKQLSELTLLKAAS
ncbi:MAG: chemotaxis protein CheW [Pseudomonas sp.]